VFAPADHRLAGARTAAIGMLTATQREIDLVRYVFDKNASRFTVQAFATGMLSAFGHNPMIGIRDFSGDVQFCAGTFEQAAVSLSVDTTTFEVLDEMKRDDRGKLQKAMNEDVLDVEHYPTAGFASKQITVQKVSNELLQASVTGELTLRGNTQNQSFDARVTLLGDTMRISSDFTIRQSDYGIKPVSFAGGALRLKDELKFAFEVVARQNDSPAGS
jgi:polyisoprenoid-binding protein YceI